MPKISIIVAVYNQEDLVPKCIESILNQSLSDFELLLINDGSQDNSKNVIDEYAKKDSRIKVIHQSNMGLAEVRNIGIKNAKGEFIGFVDGDDWVQDDMYETLYKLCVENNAEMSSCLFNMYNEGYELIHEGPNTKKVRILNSDVALELTYQHKLTSFNVWNKLFKREIFNDIKFPKNREYEDTAVLYKTYSRANKIVYIETPLYNHYVRKAGITKRILSNFSKKKLDILPTYNEAYNYMEAYHPQICDLLTFEHYKGCIDIFQYIINENKVKSNYKYIKLLSKHMKDITSRFQQNSFLTYKQKLMASILANVPIVGIMYYKHILKFRIRRVKLTEFNT